MKDSLAHPEYGEFIILSLKSSPNILLNHDDDGCGSGDGMAEGVELGDLDPSDCIASPIVFCYR